MPVLTRLLTRLWTTAAAASLIAAPVLGASAAAADTSPPPSSGARLARACGRLPHRIARLEKLQTRFHAAAGTRGSIAFLQARIDTAKTAGHDDLARLLTDRLAVRKDIDSQLPDILAKLKDAQQVCAAHPSSASTSTSTS
jgi:hypothetical protein